MKKRLSEGVVALLLVLVEALHVFRVASDGQRGGDERLPKGKGDDLEPGNQVRDESLVLFRVHSFFIGNLEDGAMRRE